MINKTRSIHRSLALVATLLAAALPLKADGPPLGIRIDGKLDEAAWKNARPLEAFKTIEFKTLRGIIPAGQKPQAQTTGLIMNDSRYLYLGFEAEEPMMEKLQTTSMPRDGSIWTNDSIEIYIAPFERENEYYQVIIDTTGQIFDGFKRGEKLDSSYDLSVAARTHKREDGWTMEVAIPLSELGLSRARAALMNFGRERKPVNEFSSWHGAFGKPETWKRLPLSLDPDYNIDVRDWSYGAAQYGRNQFALELVPATAAPINVLMQIEENGKWKTKGRKKLKGTAGKPMQVSFPYELLPDKRPRIIRYTVTDSVKPVFQTTYKLNLPAEALIAALSVPHYYLEEQAGFLNLSNILSPESLDTGRVRLTVKDPSGKNRKVKEMRPLKRSMNVAFDISAWREGTGKVLVELIASNRVIDKQEIEVLKRPGPFSEVAF